MALLALLDLLDFERERLRLFLIPLMIWFMPLLELSISSSKRSDDELLLPLEE